MAATTVMMSRCQKLCVFGPSWKRRSLKAQKTERLSEITWREEQSLESENKLLAATSLKTKKTRQRPSSKDAFILGAIVRRSFLSPATDRRIVSVCNLLLLKDFFPPPVFLFTSSLALGHR